MKATRRRVIALLLMISSCSMVLLFLDYRVQPLHVCPGSYDVICPPADQILSLGHTNIPPEPGSELARFHGATLGGRGLYSRFNMSKGAAIVGGLVVPLILLTTAGIVSVFRRSGHR